MTKRDLLKALEGVGDDEDVCLFGRGQGNFVRSIEGVARLRTNRDGIVTSRGAAKGRPVCLMERPADYPYVAPFVVERLG